MACACVSTARAWAHADGAPIAALVAPGESLQALALGTARPRRAPLVALEGGAVALGRAVRGGHGLARMPERELGRRARVGRGDDDRRWIRRPAHGEVDRARRVRRLAALGVLQVGAERVRPRRRGHVPSRHRTDVVPALRPDRVLADREVGVEVDRAAGSGRLDRDEDRRGQVRSRRPGRGDHELDARDGIRGHGGRDRVGVRNGGGERQRREQRGGEADHPVLIPRTAHTARCGPRTGRIVRARTSRHANGLNLR